MIAFVNFNAYLGGGETIFVRLAEYLNKTSEDFKLFYPENSYISKDLKRVGVNQKHLCQYSGNIDYFYSDDAQRKSLVDHFEANLKNDTDVKLVSYCFRELYTMVDVAKRIPDSTISHLILHDEDNLYLGQSLLDKLIYKFFRKKKMSNEKQIAFNNDIFYKLNNAGALIGEKETSKIVMSKYGIDIPDSHVVPPPMCVFPETIPEINNEKKILWIGRFVDFKLPAIVSMLEFISAHQDYSLSLIGDGDMNFINKVVENKKLYISNVHFLGLQPYDKIGEIIKQHSIGYACGTSIIEIGQYGLPVITALFSPNHSLYSRPICGGIYDNKYKGNEGNNLLIGEKEEDQPTIEETMNYIESNFDEARQHSFNCMKEDFDFKHNTDLYLKIIKSAKPIDVNSIVIPKCPLSRKIAYRIFK